MSEPRVIATVPKNGAEEVRVSLSTFKGHALVDVRVFADMGDEAERRATKKGVALVVAKLPALIAALQEAARAAGLPDNGRAGA